ncbi:MAG TPA: sigma-70 family RNA polymerase sigma factor [Syntrophomonadaceae bacterium]|nr:sigma-70 family RNA polymerase sigma factor [Syntrophomonadaceae bacterium]
MSIEEFNEELTNNFDETKELIDLLDIDNLLDIETLLDELKVQDEDLYMDAPLQLELHDQIAEQPGVKLLIEQVRGLPRLNFQGQRDAKERFDKGDRQALQELVITGLPWVSKIAEKYGERCPDEFLDYLHEGIFGLVQAIRRWDPKKCALAQYATFWIRQKITRYIANAGSPLRHPVHVQEKRRRVIDEIQKTGRIPPDVKNTDLASWLPPVSLNSDLSWVLRTSIQDQALRQDENPLPPDQCFFENLPDTSSLEDDIVDQLYLEEVRKWFNGLDISEKERLVLGYRYGFNSDGEEKTLEEVGKVLGVTRERVRQIEARAIKKLKHPTRLKTIKVLDKSEKQARKLMYSSLIPDHPKYQKVADKHGGKLSKKYETQVLVETAFKDLFDGVLASKTNLELALGKVKVSKIEHFWKTLFHIPPVQQTLTSHQKKIIAAVNNGELSVQYALGFMKRGLIRLYRRFLACRIVHC